MLKWRADDAFARDAREFQNDRLVAFQHIVIDEVKRDDSFSATDRTGLKKNSRLGKRAIVFAYRGASQASVIDGQCRVRKKRTTLIDGQQYFDSQRCCRFGNHYFLHIPGEDDDRTILQHNVVAIVTLVGDFVVIPVQVEYTAFG